MHRCTLTFGTRLTIRTKKTKKDVQTKRKRLIRPAKLYSRKNQPGSQGTGDLEIKKNRTLRFKQSQTFSPLCWRAQSLILTTNSTKVSFQQPSYERIRRGEATGPQRRLKTVYGERGEQPPSQDSSHHWDYSNS